MWRNDTEHRSSSSDVVVVASRACGSLAIRLASRARVTCSWWRSAGYQADQPPSTTRLAPVM